MKFSLEKIVNWTPHTVTVKPEDGAASIVFEGCEEPARTRPLAQALLPDCPLPVVTRQLAGGLAVPAIAQDTQAVLVSKMVGDYILEQGPFNVPEPGEAVVVLGPDSGPASAIRKNGQVVGVRRLEWYCVIGREQLRSLARSE